LARFVTLPVTSLLPGGCGRVIGAEIDGVFGDVPAAIVVERLAGIGVDVEARVVAGGDVEPDAVAARKDEEESETERKIEAH